MTARDYDLEAFWMPFTANRQFKAAPRILVSAKDMHYVSEDGRRILDSTAGLWCVNAGHCREPIVRAIAQQAQTLDFAPTFQMGHPGPFRLAQSIAQLAPADLDHVFFANSGSEAVDSALKIALAYHRVRGEGQRTRFIGRERAYHGVSFGGISVGGMTPNRKAFGAMLPGVDHLPHTHDLEKMANSRGQPQWGAHLADELERLVALHDASNIAAVIVEPVQGSTGVVVPPKGYLERLRAICDRHELLLIFDEVITGFGRLGKAFAADYFGVIPDMITFAKGVTSATVPMGGVIVRKPVFDAFLQGPEGIELFHGYTYSGHPLAAAAGEATLALYHDEQLFANAAKLSAHFEDAAHSLVGLPNVVDVRNIGLMAGIELAPRPGKPGARGYEALVRCFEAGVLTRVSGDTLACSPPLIISRTQIDEIFGTIAKVLREIA
ncbi:MAG: aminotransferase class III-fold pyridoxal phosphate-dependent enzyme [Betaproteobacteria bacterium]|nr:aminotransferase class III-fold pyridoxal phosphate-dependent enzyme [Betaproteobacteria bacterium]